MLRSLEAAHQELHQQRNVFLPLAQRGHADRHDIEPIEEVFAETPLGHGELQILVRAGEHAHVHRGHAFRADPLDLAVLQDAQDLRLRARREIRDLIEKDHAAMRDLEQSLSRRHRARERAAFVPEQLALHQALRNRRAVHFDEGRVGALAVRVNAVGDQFLARAAFAGDQHAGVGLRHLHRRGDHFADGRRVADDLGAAALRVRQAQALLDARHFQARFTVTAIFSAVNGFSRKSKAAELHRLRRLGEPGVAGDEDRRRRDAVGLRAAEELEPADFAQPDVDDHRIDDPLVQRAQRGGDIVRGDHVHAFLAQRDLDGIADVLLVVEHQDYGRHASAPADESNSDGRPLSS